MREQPAGHTMSWRRQHCVPVLVGAALGTGVFGSDGLVLGASLGVIDGTRVGTAVGAMRGASDGLTVGGNVPDGPSHIIGPHLATTFINML